MSTCHAYDARWFAIWVGRAALQLHWWGWALKRLDGDGYSGLLCMRAVCGTGGGGGGTCVAAAQPLPCSLLTRTAFVRKRGSGSAAARVLRQSNGKRLIFTAAHSIVVGHQSTIIVVTLPCRLHPQWFWVPLFVSPPWAPRCRRAPSVQSVAFATAAPTRARWREKSCGLQSCHFVLSLRLRSVLVLCS